MATKRWSRLGLAGGVLSALGVFHLICPLQIGVVSGASMEPTFHSRQLILVDRRFYQSHPVQRGDVVIARQGGNVLIKRVYALAGDTFWTLFNADEGELYRDIITPDKLARYRKVMPMLGSYRLARFKVPAKMVYLVGDNANASIDSRHFGPLPTTEILGRVSNAPPLPADGDRLALNPTPQEEGTSHVSRASIQ